VLLLVRIVYLPLLHLHSLPYVMQQEKVLSCIAAKVTYAFVLL
jgi:hypothetical protein